MRHGRTAGAPRFFALTFTILLCVRVSPAHAGPGIPCSAGATARAADASRALPSLVGPPPDTTEFVLFGWVSPPAESTTRARIDEMAALGFNLLLPAWLDHGCPDDDLARLDWAAADGMRCVIWDSRLMAAHTWLPSFEDTLNEVVAAYRDHPGLWGYYLGDEPPRDLWPLLARLRESLRGRDATHPGWNSLLGRGSFASGGDYLAQLRDYADAVHPVMLSDDFYAFHEGFDDPRFVENLVGLRDVAAEKGLPFWNVVQLVQHLDYRALTPGELRWQVTQCLAHGSRGIGYFTYWTPDPDTLLNWHPAILDHAGRRTAWYDFLAGFDVGVRAAGEALAHARRARTTYAGSAPPFGEAFTPNATVTHVEGRAVIGEFVGANGRPLLFVGNSDSLAARTIALDCRTTDARLVAGGSSPALTTSPAAGFTRLTLDLAAGDFALIEITGWPNLGEIDVAPNPGAGAIRFAVRTPYAGEPLDVFDLRGRRLWSRTVSTANATLVWDGRDAEGRRVPPGVYFAHLRNGSDPRRAPATVRRFVWLGAR